MDSITPTIRVTPRSSRTEVVGSVGDVLHIRLSAPPVDDAATSLLAATDARAELRVPKSCVTVIRGRKSREKVLQIVGAAGPLPWAAVQRPTDSSAS